MEPCLEDAMPELLVVGLLWMGKWKPILTFSPKAFREMFGFGSKLFVSGLIITIYRNIYYLDNWQVLFRGEFGLLYPGRPVHRDAFLLLSRRDRTGRFSCTGFGAG